MKKRNYKIVGVTQEMVEMWKENLRNDARILTCNNNNGKVQIRLSLTIFEAIYVRLSMIKYNLTHPCVLKLEKVGV